MPDKQDETEIVVNEAASAEPTVDVNAAPEEEAARAPAMVDHSEDPPPRQAVPSRSASAANRSPVVAPVLDVAEGDEDDETWTNKPAGAGGATNEGEEEAGEGEEIDDEEEDAPVATRKVIQNARDVLCEELPVRASRAKLRLHPQLTGAFLIEVSNTGEKFVFDWRGEEPKVTPASGAVTLASGDSVDLASVDCIITISEQNLMAVRSGDLNPQVAMLADKIKVQGKMGPAVYLFNLVAPRMREA